MNLPPPPINTSVVDGPAMSAWWADFMTLLYTRVGGESARSNNEIDDDIDNLSDRMDATEVMVEATNRTGVLSFLRKAIEELTALTNTLSASIQANSTAITALQDSTNSEIDDLYEYIEGVR